MRFMLIAALFAAVAVALPTDDPKPPKGGDDDDHDDGGDGGGSYKPCTSTLFSNPQCCATDVLGVVGLDCGNPSQTPSSRPAFEADCATVGQQARCCVLPVAGQAVLCQPPV